MSIITAFNQIRLSGVLVTNSGGRLQVGSDNTLMIRDSGNFANLQYVAGVSGALATLIQGSVGGVSSVNGQSGVLSVVGAGNISITTGANTIIVSGNTGAYANFATVTNLALTGSNLFTSLTGLSGAFNTQIASTGQQAWSVAQNNALNLSGNLTQTGAALVSRDLVISGGLEVRIQQTGVALINRDNSISGVLQTAINNIAAGTGSLTTNVVFTTGVQFIGGTKYFVGNTYIDNLYVTGSQFVVNTQDFYVGDNWIVLNATGGARDSALFISTGVTGINATGAILGFDVPSNTWRFGFGSQQTDLVGLGRIASGEALDAIEVRLTQSGVNLGAAIANTGSVAWNAANNNSINLSGNLAQTGAALITRDVAISGGLEVRITNTGNVAVAHANSIGVNLSGNLGITGSVLNNKINSLSGYSDNIFIHRTGNELISGNKTFTGQSSFLTPILVSASVTQPHTVAAPQAIIDVQSTLSQTNPSGIIIRRNATQYMHLHQFDGASHIIDGIGDKSIVIRNGQTSSSIDTLVVGRTGGAAQFRFDYFGNFVVGGDLTANIISGNNFYSGAIALSDLLYPRSNPSGFITGLQGTGNLASVAQLIALSGYVNAQDALTGSASWTAANNNAINLSGNLSATGITLFARDAAISGGLEARIAATGAENTAYSNTLYGTNIIYSTGNQSVGGTKSFNSGFFTGGLFVSGSNAGIYGLAEFRLSEGAYYPNNLLPILTLTRNVVNPGGLIPEGGVSLDFRALDQQFFSETPPVTARIGTVNTVSQNGNAQPSLVFHVGNSGVTKEGMRLTFDARLRVTGTVTSTSGFFSGATNLADIFASQTALQNTGSAAWNAANSNGINLSGNISQTGIALIARDLAISGGLEARIALTGQQAWSAAQNNSINLSGNLFSTGRDAVGNFGQISLHSAHTSFNTTPARWGWTYVQGNTGAPNQVSAQWYRARIGLGSEYTIGTGTGSDYWLQMAVPRYGNKDIWFQTTENGNTGAWIPAGVTVSGVLAASDLAISGGINTVIRATGSAAWSAAQNNAVNLSGNLTSTGITLFARDAAISGGLEIRLGVTGSAAVVHANNIGSIISGNLTQTGITLFTRDTAISGGLEARISVTGNLINARIDSLSGYLNRPVIPSITVSALYTVASNDPQIIYCNFSNPTALVFPSASTVSGRIWNIKSINTGAIYLSGSTFDGQSVYNMSVPFMSQVLHAQSAGYYLID